MVRGRACAADIFGVSLPPPDPRAVQAAVTRRSVLSFGVSAVTQVSTAVALTSTGVVVGVLGHQAQVADAQAAQHQQAQPEVVVVPKPVARPVRVVVVRRPARVVEVPASQPRRTRATSKSGGSSGTSARRPSKQASVPPPAAPRPTSSPAATKTSGS